MSGEYGKRPLTQWLLIYLVLGGIAYVLFYYFVYGKSGGYNYVAPTTGYTTPAPTMTK